MKTINQSDSLPDPVLGRLVTLFLSFSYLIFPLVGFAESPISAEAPDSNPTWIKTKNDANTARKEVVSQGVGNSEYA